MAYILKIIASDPPSITQTQDTCICDVRAFVCWAKPRHFPVTTRSSSSSHLVQLKFSSVVFLSSYTYQHQDSYILVFLFEEVYIKCLRDLEYRANSPTPHPPHLKNTSYKSVYGLFES